MRVWRTWKWELRGVGAGEKQAKQKRRGQFEKERRWSDERRWELKATARIARIGQRNH